MKAMLTVQGEGRGRLTQAVAVQQMLRRHGHSVVSVFAGRSPNRNLPDFFLNGFDCPVTPIVSPSFSFKDGRGIDAAATLRKGMLSAPGVMHSLRALHSAAEAHRPDVILNFFEPVTGLYNFLTPHRVPVIAIGHQFMLHHPEFVKLRRMRLQQRFMRSYVRMVGAKSMRVALSL